MKRMEFFCNSPSSTAICSSLDHRSMVRHSTTNTKQPIFGTCSSQDFFPIKQRRSTSVMLSDLYKNPASSVPDNQKQSTTFDSRRRSSADSGDLLLQLRRRQQRHHTSSGSSAHLLSSDDRTGAPYVDWISDSALVPYSDSNLPWPNRPKETSSVGGDVPVPERGHRYSSPSSSLACSGNRVSGPGQFSTVVGSPSRQSKPNGGDGMASDNKDVVSGVVPAQGSRGGRVSFQGCPPPLLKSSSSSSPRSHDQVVVLRVSIHCKGCEGKVRKHISKMEGVTSFSIDLATKQVIVKGKVTPLGVLASISKVKTAQLCPPPSSSTSAASAAAPPRWST